MRTAVLFLALAFVLAACARAPVACPQGQIMADLGCCADVNGDGVCDSAQPGVVPPAQHLNASGNSSSNSTRAGNITAPGQPFSGNETAAGNASAQPPKAPVPTGPAPLSVGRVWNSTSSFSYFIQSDDYGKLWVWAEQDRVRYISAQWLLWARNGNVSRSQYQYQSDDQDLINAVEDRSFPLINYLDTNLSTKKTDGCYVRGIDYAIKNCIPDYPNRNPVIRYDTHFAPPAGPLDWIKEREGRKPSSVQANRTLVLEGKRFSVDDYVFRDPNGETTTLSVNALYGIPLQKEVRGPDGKLIEAQSVTPTFNARGDRYGNGLELPSQQG